MECSVDGCTRKRKYVSTGWCQTHYHRWWRHGDPGHVTPTTGWRNHAGDSPKYRAAHARVQAARGKASDHLCVCGTEAEHWSYRGGAKVELVEVFGKRKCSYSPDPNDYDPLCLGCHVKRDRWHTLEN